MTEVLRRDTTTGGPFHAADPAGSVCIIVNPGSGKRRGEGLADELDALIADQPSRFNLRRVKRGQDLPRETEQAIAAGFETIVAAGGDGTISAVASRVAGTDRQLGVLPLGTFNYFARSLDLPETLEEAVQVLQDGRAIALHVGEVNGRVFLNNASLGLYPAILERRESIYRRWGRSRLAAYWSVLVALLSFRSPLRLKVTVDGNVRRLRTPFVFVASNAYQLEVFGLEGAEEVRAGRFALMVAPDRGRIGLLLYALRLAFGTIEARRDFELFFGSEILVEDRLPRRLVARDGEREVMASPFRFRMRPEALTVLVPAGRDAED